MKSNVTVEVVRADGRTSVHRAHNTITQAGLDRCADVIIGGMALDESSVRIYADSTSLGNLDDNFPQFVDDADQFVTWRVTERLSGTLNPTNFHLATIPAPGNDPVNLFSVARGDLNPALPTGAFNTGDQLRISWTLAVTLSLRVTTEIDTGIPGPNRVRTYTGIPGVGLNAAARVQDEEERKFAGLIAGITQAGVSGSANAVVRAWIADSSRDREDIANPRFAVRLGSDIGVTMSRDSAHSVSDEARLVTAPWTLPAIPSATPQGFDHVWLELVVSGIRATTFFAGDANWGSSQVTGRITDVLVRNS